MNPVSRICPVTDAEAARMVRPGTITDLADQITLTGFPARESGRLWSRRRLVLAAGLSVAGAALLLTVTSIGRPGQHVGPVRIGPQSAQALSFTTHGRYIYVIVRNPYADARKFRAEFRAHHLDIMLTLLPASPSLVGTLVAESLSPGSTGIAPITARGRCFTGGGGSNCPVGAKVPIGYKGQAALYFGRAARPGERYETTAAATAPGEAMHGMHFEGKTVASVLALLARRDVTVPVYHYVTPRGISELLRPGQVPRWWHVYGADPWAPGQVTLWVGPSRTPPAVRQPRLAAPAPSASPEAH